MPKQHIEINKFLQGISSTASSTDSGTESAKYSKNIDPATAQGRLQGIDGDKKLTTAGFVDEETEAEYTYPTVDASEMVAFTDKEDSSKINASYVTSDATNHATSISLIEDVYNSPSTELFTDIISTNAGDFNLQAHNGNVFIGLGGNKESKSKVITRIKSSQFSSDDDDKIVGLFDAELNAPNEEAFSGMFSEFITFPIHGAAIATTGISYNDSAGAHFYPDYDVVLDNTTIAFTLYNALNGGASSLIDGLKVGQVFKAHSTGDFADAAMLAWKKYDYDADAALEADDLYMFCGYIADTTYPILRFLGNIKSGGANDQKPAFAYAYKEDSPILYKISLTTTVDTSAFDGASTTTTDLLDESGINEYSLANVGSRITELDISGILNFNGNYISAVSPCFSPPLYNQLNLEGAISTPHAVDGDIYWNNGHLKILYRHGIFYIASENKKTTLFRLNAIDFHELTEHKCSIDDVNLSFDNIPNQLHAENGDGIVQRTIEDLHNSSQFDSKNYAWSNIPSNAYIVGICETFENGKVLSVGALDNSTWGGSIYAYRFNAKNKSRLASGDKVRFAGMSITTDATKNKTFNTGAPYEVNVIDDGDAFYIDSGSSSKEPDYGSAFSESYWWNAKVWVLYAKRNPSTPFRKWDLFLYNANTLDMDSGRTINVADRTVPYHQARYYKVPETTSAAPYSNSTTNDIGTSKLYYPAEFAFAKKWTQGGTQLQTSDTTYPGAPIGINNSTNPSSNVAWGTGAYCEFGIYDKSGRWSINGGATENTYANINDSGGPLNGDAYRRARTTNYSPNVSGHLYWGDNIGWSIDGEREILPIKNSLHPVVPYSSLYMGSIVYPGWNITSGDNNYEDLNSPMTHESNEVNSNHNIPRHAVTFIGKTTGKFVKRHAVISRAHSHSTGVGDCVFLSQLTEFRTQENDRQVIDEYLGDPTLYTIDDFSGHRGSLRDRTSGTPTDMLDFDVPISSNTVVSGIDLARPNWGGPEIENPKHKADQQYSEGTVNNTTQIMYSSVNGGAFDTPEDSNDKGWDGYTPPCLFTPGKGYYVYINRTWKGMTPHAAHLADPDTINGSNSMICDFAWGFQIVGSINQHSNAAIGWNSNRWNNTSSTCIADNRHQYYHDGNKVQFYNWGSVPTEESIAHTLTQSKFITTNSGQESMQADNYNYSDATSVGPNLDDADFSFLGFPSIAYSVCTMNKLNISDFNKFNSIKPFIAETTLTTNTQVADDSSNDFIAGYLCGVTLNDESSRSVVIRTNFDGVWNDMLRYYTASGYTKHGTITMKDYYMAKNRVLSKHGSSDDPKTLPLMSTSLGFIETASIVASTPNRVGGDVNTGNPPELGQILVDPFSSAVTGSIIKPFPQIPWKDIHTGADDWWIFANSSFNHETYLGVEDDRWNPNFSTNNRRDISGDYDDNQFEDEEIWSSGSDATILTTQPNFISFSNSSETTGGALSTGKYYYKLAYEYDGQFESPLTEGAPMGHTLSAASSTSGGTWDYIKLVITLPQEMVANIPKRVTGISLYRKFGGGNSDPYKLIDVISFNDTWTSIDGGYQKLVRDEGNLSWDYQTGNGIAEDIRDTSLNYSLSARFQGYLYVSQIWHPEFEDSQNYIFRSLPGNFFAFNWTDDYLIMPETPIAMTDFNSRLYVWGKNKLYKIDPINMVIEDEYDGISIASKYSFVKTEYGLCFLDDNNVYVHDGNTPTTIADTILYGSNEVIDINSAGSYVRAKAGYRELLKNTIDANYNPRVLYSALKNSFVVLLYDKDNTTGITLSYNLKLKRWDLWSSPLTKSATSAKGGDILISDGTNLIQYLTNISSEDFGLERRKNWSWYSQDINFGVDNQEKVFKTLSFTGSPAIYQGNTSAWSNPATAMSPLYTTDYPAVSTNQHSLDVYVDDKIVELTMKNKFYDTMRFADLYIGSSMTTTSDYTIVRSRDATHSQYIKDGMIIKIEDEIMFIEKTEISTSDSWRIYVTRGFMGTTAATHAANKEIYIVAPKFSFPGGTKGNRLSIRLREQTGYIDSIGITYKPKAIK